jgi:hypothetical protein
MASSGLLLMEGTLGNARIDPLIHLRFHPGISVFTKLDWSRELL